MARYVVTTRRDARGTADTGSALDVVSTLPGIAVVASEDPHVVTIDTSPETARQLLDRYGATLIVEPEVRRGLL